MLNTTRTTMAMIALGTGLIVAQPAAAAPVSLALDVVADNTIGTDSATGSEFEITEIQSRRGRGGFRRGGFRRGGFGRSRGFRNRGFRNRGFRNRGFRNRGFRNRGFGNRGFRRGGFGHGYGHKYYGHGKGGFFFGFK